MAHHRWKQIGALKPVVRHFFSSISVLAYLPKTGESIPEITFLFENCFCSSKTECLGGTPLRFAQAALTKTFH